MLRAAWRERSAIAYTAASTSAGVGWEFSGMEGTCVASVDVSAAWFISASVIIQV
jgi:hypothetical protein